MDRPTLERAIDEAQVLLLATPRERGIEETGPTRSEAERRLLTVTREPEATVARIARALG